MKTLNRIFFLSLGLLCLTATAQNNAHAHETGEFHEHLEEYLNEARESLEKGEEIPPYTGPGSEDLENDNDAADNHNEREEESARDRRKRQTEEARASRNSARERRRAQEEDIRKLRDNRGPFKHND